MNIRELKKQAFEAEQRDYWLERFAELVAAHEREECAKLCISIWNEWLDTPEEDRYKVLYDAEDCAKAIRARGKT